MALISDPFSKENFIQPSPTAKELEKDIKSKVKKVEKLLKEAIPAEGGPLTEHEIRILNKVQTGLAKEKATLIDHVQKLGKTLAPKEIEAVISLIPLLEEQETKIKAQLFTRDEAKVAESDIEKAKDCLDTLFAGIYTPNTATTLSECLTRLSQSSLLNDSRVKELKKRMRDYESMQVYFGFAQESIRAIRGETTKIIDPDKTITQCFKKFEELGVKPNHPRVLALQKDLGHALAACIRNKSTRIPKPESRLSECLQRLDSSVPNDPEVVALHKTLTELRVDRLEPTGGNLELAGSLMKFGEMHWNTNQKMIEVAQLLARPEVDKETKDLLKTTLQHLLNFRNALNAHFTYLPVRANLEEITEEIQKVAAKDLPGFIKNLNLNINELNRLHGFLNIKLLDSTESPENKRHFSEASRALKIIYEEAYKKQDRHSLVAASKALNPEGPYGELAKAIGTIIPKLPKDSRLGLINFQTNTLQKLVEGLLGGTPKDANHRQVLEACYTFISPLIDGLNRSV